MGASDQARYDKWAKENGKQSGGSSGNTNFRPEQGMFGLDNIMNSFYNYKPDGNDEFGNYQKNTFASNMIQSAFDTQNAKDLAYTQAEISSGMMNQAAELQRLNTKDIMRKEYQYGTDMMKQQFQYQSEFADDQYSRDKGMVGIMGMEQRKTEANRQDSAERIARGQYETQQAVANKQLEGTKYSADQQLTGIRDTNQSNLAGTKYTADQQLAGIRDTNIHNLAGTKYTADTNLTGTKYSSDRQYQGVLDTNRSNLAATSTADSNVNIAGKQLEGTKYSSDRQYQGVLDTNRSTWQRLSTQLIAM